MGDVEGPSKRRNYWVSWLCSIVLAKRIIKRISVPLRLIVHVGPAGTAVGRQGHCPLTLCVLFLHQTLVVTATAAVSKPPSGFLNQDSTTEGHSDCRTDQVDPLLNVLFSSFWSCLRAMTRKPTGHVGG